jgi:hypothetical protein
VGLKFEKERKKSVKLAESKKRLKQFDRKKLCTFQPPKTHNVPCFHLDDEQ